MPNKQQAWSDLIQLTNDDDWSVRSRAAEALGSAFPYLPDKQQAWEDLHRLSNDMKDRQVRTYANHSLGKISIFKASQAKWEENYKEELEKAIVFFEKATKEPYDRWSMRSQFCLPFYRSFHAIVFKRHEAKEEVNKYLVEAKYAVRGSKNKELLFEAVENLANALKEVQSLENMDSLATQEELNFYRKYCDRAAELMKDAEETAPYAVEAMIRGLPILDRNLKQIIKGIQAKSKITCQKSQGTSTQKIACAVNQEVQNWGISSQKEMTLNVSKVIMILKSKIPCTLENKEILDLIESMKYEKDLSKQYGTLFCVIGLIPTVTVVPVDPIIEKVDTLERKINDIMFYIEPGVREDLILHIGPITPYGGAEYTLTIPLQELSSPEIKEELKGIAGKRVSQLSMLPKKTAKIMEDYLVKNKMEDLLKKLR